MSIYRFIYRKSVHGVKRICNWIEFIDEKAIDIGGRVVYNVRPPIFIEISQDRMVYLAMAKGPRVQISEIGWQLAVNVGLKCKAFNVPGRCCSVHQNFLSSTFFDIK